MSVARHGLEKKLVHKYSFFFNISLGMDNKNVVSRYGADLAQCPSSLARNHGGCAAVRRSIGGHFAIWFLPLPQRIETKNIET